MRNPKDVVVSYEHHCRIMKVQDFTGDQDEFVKEFTNGDCEFTFGQIELGFPSS